VDLYAHRGYVSLPKLSVVFITALVARIFRNVLIYLSHHIVTSSHSCILNLEFVIHTYVRVHVCVAET